MTAKFAHGFDLAGLWTGAVLADESPLEPGVFLLPARSTFVAPPEDVAADLWPRWNGAGWDLVPRPAPAEPENPLAKLQAFLQANPDVAAIINTGGV